MIRLVVVVEDTGVWCEHRDDRGTMVARARIGQKECRELAARLTQAAERFDEVQVAKAGGKR